MNPALEASIRQLIEKVLAEKDLVSTSEVNDLVELVVDRRLAAELGVAPQAPTHPVQLDMTPVHQSRAVVKPLDEPKKNGRRPKQSDAERKAKRASYQRNYRARQKTKGGAEGATNVIALPAPAPIPARKAPLTPTRQVGPKKVENGAPAGPPPIAYVPSVDLGEI